MEFNEATKAFDLAFMFTDEDTGTTHLILLVKVCRSLLTSFLLHPLVGYRTFQRKSTRRGYATHSRAS